MNLKWFHTSNECPWRWMEGQTSGGKGGRTDRRAEGRKVSGRVDMQAGETNGRADETGGRVDDGKADEGNLQIHTTAQRKHLMFNSRSTVVQQMSSIVNEIATNKDKKNVAVQQTHRVPEEISNRATCSKKIIDSR